MGRGRLPGLAIARIDRYQHTHAERGHCQFSPTCSRYAKEAFRERAFPVALLMTVSRIARCNLFAAPNTADPVVRPHRGLRPNTLLSLSMIGVVSGVMLIGFASAGGADAFRGVGCTGNANGRNIASMTRSNPLLLKEHTRFAAQGTAGFAGPSDPTAVAAKIQIISGLFGVTTTNDSGTGNAWSSSKVNVDDYFKFGVGLYEVDITVSGSGGSCTATAFVKLDGNPLTKPAGIAGTIAVVGGAGTGVRARRKGKNPMRMDDNEAFVSDLLDDSDKQAAAAAAAPAGPESPDVGDMGIFEFSRYMMGCATMALLALPVFGMGAGAATAERPVVWSKKVRVHGHPILGFFAGLVAGLGAVVLLWQYAVWTLQVWNTIGIPVLVGLLGGVLAWRGKGYVIKVRGKAPSVTTAGGSATQAP